MIAPERTDCAHRRAVGTEEVTPEAVEEGFLGVSRAFLNGETEGETVEAAMSNTRAPLDKAALPPERGGLVGT